MEKEKLTVLIVEDQHINRQILNALLSVEYRVLEAENGAVALDQLKEHEEIAAILLDLVMPVMDGYEFLRQFRQTPRSQIPVIAITGDKDDRTEQKALSLGAWDFVSKPFQPSTLATRLKNVIVRSQYYLVSEMKYSSEHDSLTGLLNRSAFFAAAHQLLTENPGQKFAMIRMDVDDFQTYNSFWGEEEGDKFLCAIAGWLRQAAERCVPSVYGRINADAFGICMPDCADVIQREAAQIFEAIGTYNPEYRLVPSIGVYEISDPAEKPQKMYELAALAARSCKGSYLEYLSYYKPEQSEHVLENQWIVNEMQHALDSEQFEVFLQPKYALSTKMPYGAEALIRWRHPEKGLLSPGVFIPVFEQNGFIGKVDYYMWEHTCMLLRKWIDEGLNPAPISVNVSRMDLFRPDLVEQLAALVKRYDIPPRLLQLEMTESTYMANQLIMEKVVRELQSCGFTILMDDFGSGYSSLNTLKEIHVDVLKIDMKFLSEKSEVIRSRTILASIILMAVGLDMPVIMEGVETAAQAAFLQSIGCNYVQGYYFARPMPVPDYEKLIFGVHQAPSQKQSENLEQVTWTLWSTDPHKELLFNAIEEPAAIYEVTLEQLRALRVNRSFDRIFSARCHMDRLSRIPVPPSVDGQAGGLIFDTMLKAVETRSEASCRFELTALDQSVRTIRMRLYYLGRNDTVGIVFAQFFTEN